MKDTYTNDEDDSQQIMQMKLDEELWEFCQSEAEQELMALRYEEERDRAMDMNLEFRNIWS